MITASDLLEPNGDVVLELFPGRTADTVNTLLTNYIADGYARCKSTMPQADQDRAAFAWANARVNRNVLSRLSRTPASVSLTNEGSTTMLGEQIRTFARAADKWEAEFDAIAATAPSPDDTPTSAALNRYIP